MPSKSMFWLSHCIGIPFSHCKCIGFSFNKVFRFCMEYFVRWTHWKAPICSNYSIISSPWKGREPMPHSSHVPFNLNFHLVANLCNWLCNLSCEVLAYWNILSLTLNSYVFSIVDKQVLVITLRGSGVGTYF